MTDNHDDRLDRPIFARPWRRFVPSVIAPLANAAVIRRHAAAIAVETRDRGDRTALSDGLSLHLGPTSDWSGRGIANRQLALWSSIVPTGAGGGVLYHIGETAYGDGSILAAIRARHGAPDVAVLPIAAFEPR